MTYTAHYIPKRHATVAHVSKSTGYPRQSYRTPGGIRNLFKPASSNQSIQASGGILTEQPRSLSHEQQVRKELREAGLGRIDMLSIESHNIHKLLHPNEHIRAAICGRSNLRALPALIVATNLRVIYLHRIPLFTTMDEIPYDLVSGVSYNRVGPWYAAVTLHTRNGDYELMFVNQKAATTFIETIEQSSIDSRSVAISTSGMLKSMT